MERSLARNMLNNRSEYEHYEDDLNAYRSRSKSKLQEWSLLESQYFTKTAEQVEMGATGKGTTKEPPVESFSEKVVQEFQKATASTKSNEELKSEMAEMRLKLQELNSLVDQKLNKYELAEIEPKGVQNINEPEKEAQLIRLTMETNRKVLEGLEKEIMQLKKKDKELEERDYLIELEERANEIINFISGKKREAHLSGVTVHKLDAKLIELKDAALENQSKEIKVIKHQFLYYFKKYHENETLLSELDKRHEELAKKDAELGKKYEAYTKLAEQKNLLVKANKHYLENKKTQDELSSELNKNKKKIDVAAFSTDITAEKIERDILKIKKEIEVIDLKTKSASQASEELSLVAKELIQKNHIGNGQIKSIAYRFAETLLLGDKSPAKKSPTPTLEPKSSRGEERSQPFFKPKLKVKSIDKNNSKIEKSEDLTSRYQTIDLYSSPVNDKNHSIDLEKKSTHFRVALKPNIQVKKRRVETQEVGNSIDEEAISSGIHKPKRFNRREANKSGLPTGPLSDDYMRRLEEKGRKNLEGLGPL